MKVALVHDYLNQYGGAERVLEILHGIFPDAPVYTLIYDCRHMPDSFREWDIKESFLGKLPFKRRHYEKYFFLMPMAIESFDLNEYDLIISISSAWAKGIITMPSTTHINYMLNPMRFAWHSYHPLIKSRKGLNKILLFFGLHSIRLWDEVTSKRPDIIIGISKTVAKRIEKFYGIKPPIVYPPVNTSFFTADSSVKKEDFFLIVSRLRPYKRIDIAISAFNDLKLPLLIIGEGLHKGELIRQAKRNIQFLGKTSDEEVRSYYRRARALIFPTFEDFGIVPLEASACGTPVIAYKEGGATETIEEGKNGTFFHPQNAEALKDAIIHFQDGDFDAEQVRRVSLKFSEEQFISNMRGVIEKFTGYSG